MNTTKLMFAAAVFAVFCAGTAYAQNNDVSDYNKLIEVLPPSPNAASLGTYGGINFNLSSGAMTTSIPVAQLASRQLSVPVTLNYNAAGIRINDIGSDAGIAWNIQAGGVITRTVYGNPDENNTRLQPPATYPQRNRDLVNFMDALSNSKSEIEGQSTDGEPDLFSFSFAGYSGRFVLNNSLQPLVLEYTPLAIEVNFSSTDWNFKITAPDGIQYYFGGSGATETTKTNSTGASCGRAFRSLYTPTGHFLKKIVHPGSDEINFYYTGNLITYASGISEIKYKNLGTVQPASCSSASSCPALNNSTCISSLMVSGLLLDKIQAATGDFLKFQYTSREDINNGKLLSSITLNKRNESNAHKVFSFAYTLVTATTYTNSYSNSDLSLRKRYFLNSFTESPLSGTPVKKYEFSYNTPEMLPPRLSYAQDHWGYFNGKSNTTLIPKPELPAFQAWFPSATANREPDAVYAQKGMLQTIKYPTGGTDEIQYGGNDIYTTITQYPNATTLYVSDDNQNTGPVSSSLGQIGFTQNATLSASLSWQTSDGLHNKGTIKVINTASNTTVYTGNLTETNSQFQSVINLEAGKTYSLEVTAFGINGTVTANASINYMPGNLVTYYGNKTVSGIRVNRIITKDNTGTKQGVKNYLYTAPGTSNSSGISNQEVLYQKTQSGYYACSGSDFIIKHYDCTHSELYSSTSLSNIMYGGLPVTYTTVTEKYGDNYESGGTEHQFLARPDVQGNIILGSSLVGGPLTHTSYNNGKEIYKKQFKKSGSSFLPVAETFIHYNENDARINNEIKGYITNKKASYNGPLETPPNEYELGEYDLYEYSYFQRWSYIDKITERLYDNDGTDYTETITETEYGNPLHALPTKTYMYNSKGENKTSYNYYPQDITLSGTAELARQSLITKNIISPVLKQKVTKDNTETVTVYNDYYNPLAELICQSMFHSADGFVIKKFI